MKVTFVGTGDAFGSGGRSHTCIRIDARSKTLLLDFGAASIVGWRRLGFSFNDVDAIFITHLHGDHFGGLPFLMLESQFVEPRSRPLTIMGPPGLRARLSMAMEAFFPRSSGLAYRFPWTIEEVPPNGAFPLAGFDLRTVEVVHSAGGPPTAVRVTRDGKSLAFSGDSAWTDELIDISAGADLFVCECHSMTAGVPGHMDWPRLRENLPRISAKRTFVTHMGADVLANVATICREGAVEAADDGLVLDL